MGDPVIIAIVAGAGIVLVLSVIAHLWTRYREARYYARRRVDLRKQRDFLETQQREIEQLAGRIIATSSTASIAGYTLVRQIEAIFTDGHPTPNQAVQWLKAMAAEKGANAIINLTNARPPSGKCVAHGDAVIVRPVGGATPPKTSPPDAPGPSASGPPRGN